MERIGVIIGRFQVAALHKGHTYLVDYALQRNRHVLILVGVSEANSSMRNPLSFETRKEMILESFPKVSVMGINDCSGDEQWSKDVDSLIEKEFPLTEITLYGSRDSFQESYYGKFKVITIPEIPNMSGTILRQVEPNPKCKKSFRLGIIEAHKFRYPTSYQTVDIGLVKKLEGLILLGRKGTDPKNLWRLPGGFVDPGDKTLEEAASRELKEEVSNVLNGEFFYLGSHRIDDYRYRNGPDKVMTAVFLTYYLGGNEQPGDEFEAVDWFSFKEADQIVIKSHCLLVEIIRRHVNGY